MSMGIIENGAYKQVAGNVPLQTTYSTEETKTGATWIDGKPVYRRVFTNLPISSTWSQHTVDNSSQDSLVSYTILGKSGVSGNTHTTPYFDGTGDNFQVAVVVGAGSLNYWGSASTITAFDMVVEYTKTTDA